MSEAHHITLASTSNAQDAAWLAVADVAAGSDRPRATAVVLRVPASCTWSA